MQAGGALSLTASLACRLLRSTTMIAQFVRDLFYVNEHRRRLLVLTLLSFAALC
jgi:hypothetical protein